MRQSRGSRTPVAQGSRLAQLGCSRRSQETHSGSAAVPWNISPEKAPRARDRRCARTRPAAEARYQREARPLQSALGAGVKPAAVIDSKRAASYLQDAGRLFSKSPPLEQRRFVREVFERVVVSGEQVAEILPSGKYMSPFVADRNRRFNRDT